MQRKLEVNGINLLSPAVGFSYKKNKMLHFRYTRKDLEMKETLHSRASGNQQQLGTRFSSIFGAWTLQNTVFVQ